MLEQQLAEVQQTEEPLLFEGEQQALDRLANEPFSSQESLRLEEDKEESKALIAVALSDTNVLSESSPLVDFSETEQQLIERERVYRDLMLQQQVLTLSQMQFADESLRAMEAKKLFDDNNRLKPIEDASVLELQAILENQTLLEHHERNFVEAENQNSDYGRDQAVLGIRDANQDRQALAEIVQGIDREYGGFGVSDLGAHFVPFYSSQVYVSLARDVFGLTDVFGSEGIAPGIGASLALDKMNEKFANASLEEQVEMLGRFSQWAESGSGLWMGSGNNRLAVSAAASQVFMRALEGEDASVFEKRVLDVANALDLAGVGALVRSATGFGMLQLRMSKEANQAALMAAKQDERAASQLKVDVVTAESNAVVPNPAVTPVVLTREQQEIVDYANLLKTGNLTDLQRTQVEEKIAELVQRSGLAMETRLMKYSHEKTTFTPTEGSLRITEHYDTPVKITNTRGTKELKEMLDVKFGQGAYQLVKENGYYTVKVNREMTFSANVQNMAEFGIPDGAFATGLFSGQAWQVPEAKFGADILRSLSMGRQSQELAARATKSLADLRKLSANEQQELNALLMKYSGIRMPAEEFNRLNDAQKRAFSSIKETLDAMWWADNQLVRDGLVAQGKMQASFRTETGFNSYIGKPLLNVEQASTIIGRRDADGLVDVLDQATNKVIKVDIQKAYAEGKYLFKLDDSKGLASDVILIDRAKGKSDIIIGEIPLTVLNYRENYIPRYYDKMYIVERLDPETGRKIPVAATNSKKEADLMATNYEGGSIRLSREASDQADTALDTWGTKLRGVGLGSRGEGLVDVSGSIAQMDNAVEALTRAARAFGARHGSREFVENLKQQWLRTYPELAEIRNGVPHFPPALRLTKESDKGARALYDYINKLQGVQRSATAKGWMKTMQVFADAVESVVPNALGTGVAKALNQLGMKDPSRGARTLAFYTLLALNPTRQFFMQAQHSLLSANLVPEAALPNKMYQGMMLQLAGADGASKSARAFYRAAAEKSGISGAEFDAMLKLYQDLGIRRSVSTHYLVDDVVRTFSSAGGGFAGMAKNAAHYGLGVPLNAAKTIGFDAGNHVNAMGAFMAALTKYQREFPGASINSAAARDAIRRDFDKYIWYMGREGTGSYTEGALGALMQFMTIQHKGLVTMLPARLGGRTDMTAMEKARTGGALFALYGADGFGLVNMINKIQRDVGEEYLSNEATQLLQQGMLGTFVSQVAGEDVDMGTWSPVGTNVAAWGAGFMTTLMKDDGLLRVYQDGLNSMNLDTGRDFFPVATSIKRMVDIAGRINTITKFDESVFSNQEKFQAALKEIAAISGTMNNIQKMLIMNQHNKSISSTGNVITDRDNERHFFVALLGLQGVEEREIYRVAGEVYRAGQRDIDLLPDASNAGRDFYNEVKVLLMKHQENFDLGSIESQRALDSILKNHVVKYIGDDATYKMSFMEGFSRALLDDSGEDAMTRMILNNVGSRAHQMPITQLKNLQTQIRNLNGATKGKYQELEDIVDMWIQQRSDIDRSYQELNMRGQ